MKKFITIITLSAIGLFNFSFAAVMAKPTATKTPITNNQPHSSVTTVNKIVAIVNNEVITQTQLNQQLTVVKAQLKTHHVALPDKKQLEQQVLDQLINRQLQLQLAQRNHIQVSNQEINQAIQSVAQQNHTTTSKIYQKQAVLGLNRQSFRQQLREDLIIQKLQQDAMSSRITVTPQEVKNYIKNTQSNPQQYHLADILVTLPATPSPKQISDAQQRANQLLKQLHNGANFQQLAAAHSGAQNALKGGDLGWRTIGELPDAFAKQVSTLKPSEVAGPIRTGNGFHLIKLIGERTPTVTATKSANSAEENQVKQILFQRKMLQDLQSWISQLRAQAYIKIMV